MSKRLAVIGCFVALCVVSVIIVSGCYEKTTANNQEKQAVCQKDTQTACPKALDVDQKKICSSKKSLACAVEGKKVCCASKQKAGTCPLKSSETDIQNTCSKKVNTCTENK